MKIQQSQTMMKKVLVLAGVSIEVGVAALSLVSLSARASVVPERKVGGAVIKFVVPKGEGYADKVDFAQLDSDPAYKIPQAALDALTPEEIAGWSQEELDQLYARLPSGPIPDGAFKGSIILAPGAGMKRMLDVASGKEQSTFVRDHKFLNLATKALGMEIKGDEDLVRLLGESFWHGKVFYRDQKVLRNLLEPWHVRFLSWLAMGKLGLKFSGPNTSPDPAIKKGEFGHKEKRLFPAKLYCGQSILDSRRESVIIDYAYSDELPGYGEAPKLNAIASRKGLQIRDEIRMVKPGFYLGRAYAAKAFLLNFTLYNPKFTKSESECWPVRDEKI